MLFYTFCEIQLTVRFQATIKLFKFILTYRRLRTTFGKKLLDNKWTIEFSRQYFEFFKALDFKENVYGMELKRSQNIWKGIEFPGPMMVFIWSERSGRSRPPLQNVAPPLKKAAKHPPPKNATKQLP